MKPAMRMHSTLIPEPYRSQLMALGSAANGEEFVEGNAKDVAQMNAMNVRINDIRTSAAEHHPELFKAATPAEAPRRYISAVPTTRSTTV